MTASLNDLLAQKAALEKQIAEAQRNERAQAVTQVRDLMARYGLSLSDLNPRSGAPRGRSGAKVAPKYRDPSTGNTWTGRGLQPKWLKAALASGRKLSDFVI